MADYPDYLTAVLIDYTNWRGERRVREILPRALLFASNEWHPEMQWLLDALDVEDNKVKTFALANIHKWEVPSRAKAISKNDIGFGNALLETLQEEIKEKEAEIERLYSALDRIASKDVTTLHEAQGIAFGALTAFA